jgi:hypothetical protein
METKDILKTILKRVDNKLKENKEKYKKLIQKMPVNDLDSYKNEITDCLTNIKMYGLISDKLRSIHSDDLNYIEARFFKELLAECGSRYQVSYLQVIVRDIERLKEGKKLDVIEVSI